MRSISTTTMTKASSVTVTVAVAVSALITTGVMGNGESNAAFEACSTITDGDFSTCITEMEQEAEAFDNGDVLYLKKNVELWAGFDEIYTQFQYPEDHNCEAAGDDYLAAREQSKCNDTLLVKDLCSNDDSWKYSWHVSELDGFTEECCKWNDDTGSREYAHPSIEYCKEYTEKSEYGNRWCCFDNSANINMTKYPAYTPDIYYTTSQPDVALCYTGTMTEVANPTGMPQGYECNGDAFLLAVEDEDEDEDEDAPPAPAPLPVVTYELKCSVFMELSTTAGSTSSDFQDRFTTAVSTYLEVPMDYVHIVPGYEASEIFGVTGERISFDIRDEDESMEYYTNLKTTKLDTWNDEDFKTTYNNWTTEFTGVLTSFMYMGPSMYYPAPETRRKLKTLPPTIRRKLPVYEVATISCDHWNDYVTNNYTLGDETNFTIEHPLISSGLDPYFGTEIGWLTSAWVATGQIFLDATTVKCMMLFNPKLDGFLTQAAFKDKSDSESSDFLVPQNTAYDTNITLDTFVIGVETYPSRTMMTVINEEMEETFTDFIHGKATIIGGTNRAKINFLTESEVKVTSLVNSGEVVFANSQNIALYDIENSGSVSFADVDARLKTLTNTANIAVTDSTLYLQDIHNNGGEIEVVDSDLFMIDVESDENSVVSVSGDNTHLVTLLDVVSYGDITVSGGIKAAVSNTQTYGTVTVENSIVTARDITNHGTITIESGDVDIVVQNAGTITIASGVTGKMTVTHLNDDAPGVVTNNAASSDFTLEYDGNSAASDDDDSDGNIIINYKLEATTTLGGYTEETFDDTAQTAFIATIASIADCEIEYVTIDSYSATTTTRTRRKLAEGLLVEYSIETAEEDAEYMDDVYESLNTVTPAEFETEYTTAIGGDENLPEDFTILEITAEEPTQEEISIVSSSSVSTYSFFTTFTILVVSSFVTMFMIL